MIKFFTSAVFFWLSMTKFFEGKYRAFFFDQKVSEQYIFKDCHQ